MERIDVVPLVGESYVAEFYADCSIVCPRITVRHVRQCMMPVPPFRQSTQISEDGKTWWTWMRAVYCPASMDRGE